jgi:hypothetical protein
MHRDCDAACHYAECCYAESRGALHGGNIDMEFDIINTFVQVNNA